jgi:uncharacterized protein (DUF1330 family)
MPAYVIASIDVHDPDGYEDYKALSTQAAAAHGGRFLVRGGAVDVLEGAQDKPRVVVLEFPDAAAARGWWDSPEYAEARAIRQRTAATDMIVVEGL